MIQSFGRFLLGCLSEHMGLTLSQVCPMPCCATFLSHVFPIMGTEAVCCGAVDSCSRGSLPQDAPCPGGSSKLLWFLL